MNDVGTARLTLAARVLTVCYLILLIVLAVIPRIESDGAAPADWVLHSAAYGLLGGILLFSGSRSNSLLSRGALAVGGASGFGLLTEIIQLLVPYRSFELRDLAADTAGALAVVLGLLVMFRLVGGQRWAKA